MAEQDNSILKLFGFELKRAEDKQRKGLELTEEEQTALNNKDKEEELFKLTPEENTQLSKAGIEKIFIIILKIIFG